LARARCASCRSRTKLACFVGLHDERGQLLSVGRFADLDVERGQIIVSAPPPATQERVRLIVFGRVRVAPDGSGGTEIKPGEI
jgi:polynucleotide 5'-kinase involved in rRNA processing